MEIGVVIQSISTVGFPIAVTLYLLWERNTGTKELSKAVTGLTETVNNLSTLVKLLLDKEIK